MIALNIFLYIFSLLQPDSSIINRVKEGDIIFETSNSVMSKAIETATHSKYSHVGVIFKRNGEWMVFEAVQPVKFTPLKSWLQHSDANTPCVIKRLKTAEKTLTPDVVQKMKLFADKAEGKNYDFFYEWTDETYYCSELVYKIYKSAAGLEIGQMKKLKDYDLTHPVVKSQLEIKYGKNIPYEHPMIAPGAIFDSPLLTEVK